MRQVSFWIWIIHFWKYNVKLQKVMVNILQRAEVDKVRIINYPVFSLSSQVDINLGGKVISSSNNSYPYRSYIESLLNYSKETKNTQLVRGLFYKDTVGHFD